MAEPGEYKLGAFEAISSKQVVQQLDCILKLLATTKFFGVYNDKERVCVAHFFHTAYNSFKVAVPIS